MKNTPPSATSNFLFLALRIVLSSSASQPVSGFVMGLLENVSSRLALSPAVTLVIVLIVLTAVRSGAQMGETLLMGRAGQSIQMDVRNAIFGKLMKVRPLGMLKVQKGDLISRFVADVNMMEMAITHAAASILRDGLQVVFLAALAFYLNPVLSLVAVLVLPLGAFIVYALSGRIRKAYRGAMEQRGRIASMFIESARGLPVIKIFLAERGQMERLRAANLQLMNSMMKAIVLAATTSPVMEIVGSCALGLLILYVLFVSKTHLDRPETFISFFATVFLLFRPIKSLGSVTSFLQQGLAATRRISAIFDMEEDAPGGKQAAAPLEREILMSDVRFSYEDREILSGITLAVRRGKITAVVGASGEGKTTLIHLLCGFLQPSGGKLEWDGADYAGLETRSLRGRISLVSQDPFLMNASIEENILLGRNEERSAGLDGAVSAAGLDAMLPRLKHGLRTDVEEEASALSSGERQRICIARALLSDTDLMIFDEAASSLDSRSEDVIHSALKEIVGRKTILVVSHRLSTVKMADTVAVIAGGKVVEEGSYGELARPGTAFHDLFASQL
jgi:subfamily B ATP-binding cassette protein MsbA